MLLVKRRDVLSREVYLREESQYDRDFVFLIKRCVSLTKTCCEGHREDFSGQHT
jgi:hypothetical protein